VSGIKWIFRVTGLGRSPGRSIINDDRIDHDRRFLEKREKLDKKIGVVDRLRSYLKTFSGYAIRTGLTEPRSVSELHDM
jgi:hypothetical protein